MAATLRFILFFRFFRKLRFFLEKGFV